MFKIFQICEHAKKRGKPVCKKLRTVNQTFGKFKLYNPCDQQNKLTINFNIYSWRNLRKPYYKCNVIPPHYAHTCARNLLKTLKFTDKILRKKNCSALGSSPPPFILFIAKSDWYENLKLSMSRFFPRKILNFGTLNWKVLNKISK